MANNKIFDIFCDNCDNILDISRAVHFERDIQESDTPDTVSSVSPEEQEQLKENLNLKDSTESNDNYDYESFLKKIEAGEKVSNEELKSIDIKEMVKDEYYKKMLKKGEVKKKIIDMIDDMDNSDENKNAYLICNNCAFSKIIEPKFLVISKNPDGVVSYHDYINESNYRNRVHTRTAPCTRNFNCPNKECPVYKKKGLIPEAVFFRKKPTGYDTIYVCKHCLTIKPI